MKTLGNVKRMIIEYLAELRQQAFLKPACFPQIKWRIFTVVLTLPWVQRS
jgi:hypothetical protein